MKYLELSTVVLNLIKSIKYLRKYIFKKCNIQFGQFCLVCLCFSYFNFTTFLHFVPNSHSTQNFGLHVVMCTYLLLCKQTTVKISGKGLLKQVHIFSIQPRPLFCTQVLKLCSHVRKIRIFRLLYVITVFWIFWCNKKSVQLCLLNGIKGIILKHQLYP